MWRRCASAAISGTPAASWRTSGFGRERKRALEAVETPLGLEIARVLLCTHAIAAA